MYKYIYIYIFLLLELSASGYVLVYKYLLAYILLLLLFRVALLCYNSGYVRMRAGLFRLAVYAKVGASIILCDTEWLTSDRSSRNNTEQLSSGVSNRKNRIWKAGTTGNGTVITFPRVFLLTYPVENYLISSTM